MENDIITFYDEVGKKLDAIRGSEVTLGTGGRYTTNRANCAPS